MKRLYTILITALILSGCSQVPRTSSVSESLPSIFPDNTGITVPSNIAPVNFRINDQADRYLTLLESPTASVEVSGRNVCIPRSKWNRLKQGGEITVTVFVKRDGKWSSLKSFPIHVSSDEIDRYISYRLIPPLFESYNRLSINQRDLTSFKEKVIYANEMAMEDGTRHCINCHNYRNYKTDNMQFHVRQNLAGTIMYTDGKLHKLNLKTDSTISAGVYPSWHPTHDYVAYSNNFTFQRMHMNFMDRNYVLDTQSDLILYDIKNNAVSIIENDPDQLECYPSWSPDGRTLYYVSARDTKGGTVRYNLYSKPFDPDTRAWGESRLIINADSMHKSVTLPRVSPDGRWLLVAMGSEGVFQIGHSESGLAMMDLTDGSLRLLDEVNSPKAESYHSWSSNGKWIIFSTRRDEGEFTRLYIAHMEENGTFSKPFQLPQRDPEFSDKFLNSFNIPEFMIEPVRVSARQLASFIKSSKAENASFESKIEQ